MCTGVLCDSSLPFLSCTVLSGHFVNFLHESLHASSVKEERGQVSGVEGVGRQKGGEGQEV